MCPTVKSLFRSKDWVFYGTLPCCSPGAGHDTLIWFMGVLALPSPAAMWHAVSQERCCWD
jgi:hypothetical protein